MPKMRITEQESWERLNFIGFTPSSTLLVVKVQYRGFFLFFLKRHIDTQTKVKIKISLCLLFVIM